MQTLKSKRLPAPLEEVPASEAAAKLKTLEEIMASGNDNDPRLDTDFNNLSPEAKRLFRQKYGRLKPEMFNQKGTIVFLLGENLTSNEDWAFLRQVVDEPPCLSLADCSQKSQALETDPDAGLGSEVTLAYPQIMALKAAEDVLQNARKAGAGSLSPQASQALSVLEAGKTSQSSEVSDMAKDIEGRLAPAGQ